MHSFIIGLCLAAGLDMPLDVVLVLEDLSTPWAVEHSGRVLVGEVTTCRGPIHVALSAERIEPAAPHLRVALRHVGSPRRFGQEDALRPWQLGRGVVHRRKLRKKL
jgi:hypothetical protein